MANVQVTVRLRREAGDHLPLKVIGSQVTIYDSANKITRNIVCSVFVVGCADGKIGHAVPVEIANARDRTAEVIIPVQRARCEPTDAIADLLEAEAVYAHPFSGTRYDCGSKLGYLQASVAYGLARDDIGEEFRAFLKDSIG